MDYELAKQLKDAGFPQKEPNGFSGLLAHVKGNADDSTYYPTLEELIEACGDHFFTLELRNGGYKRWEAHEAYYNNHHDGSTPTEAVARLWLALNAS
jgi:hypothetical protein